MKTLALFAGLPLVLTAACSGGEGNSSTPVVASSPVAAAPAAAGRAWSETVVKTDEGYRMGNPAAPIKLVEYGARSCPVCGQFARDGFQPLVANYVNTGKVSFEFRDFLVHGASDVALSLVGKCTTTEANFFPVLEQMYGNQNAFLDKLQALSPAQQQALQSMTPNQVATALAEAMGAIDFVKQRGIPEAKARECLSSSTALEAIAKPTETAMANQSVPGTPTFFINDKVVANTVAWADLEKALKAAGA